MLYDDYFLNKHDLSVWRKILFLSANTITTFSTQNLLFPRLARTSWGSFVVTPHHPLFHKPAYKFIKREDPQS